ncbi:MFS general substrate transporter [Dendrothele bispora CBS 962.96]|uniref:MFS general substrate transporter n=1 Tax=Dendrothele bispora (strain CBS 962.96) TaxID=1314807 RepID=A0A4S8LFQ5_DENBC|nr:MFS general substrate transporter [Dendrothele bispora CBS 962.96]
MSNMDRVASVRSDRELEKQGAPTANSHEDSDAEFGGTEERKKLEKKLLMKIDLRMSILVIIYILNYIDRNNAGAARLKGFEEDLKLQGQEFATLLSILYVGYILMQVPSNMLLNKIGKPSIYLPVCMAIWGTISILTGITRNFVGALLTRFFLGFVEAAFYPGALFLLSKWYKKDEIGLRTAMLTCGSIISNGFGALIASGILKGMEGKLGDRAWRWLFYIEGALTVFFALVAAVVLPDFPATTRSLSPIEQRLAMRRMEEDAGVGDQEETEDSEGGMIHGLVLAVTDWKMWALALGLTSQVIALSFNAYFPTLTATLGYSETITLLLCAPPWVLTALVAFLWARHSDQTQERAFHIVVPFFVGIVGFVIAISTQALAARYVSLFLMALGYCGFICLYAWIPSCFPRPPSKRAISIAFINAFSQLGNVAGSYIWDKSWGPSYARSYGICIATSGFAIIVVLFFRWHLARLNRKMEEEEEQSGDEKDVGRSGFRYVL